MKNIILLVLLAFTSFLHAQNVPTPSAFHFKNPNSILPGRIFGTERETGHNIQAPIVNNNELHAASLFSIQIIDSLLFWEWDTASNRWNYFQKISEITYNDAHLPKSYVQYEWEGEWIPVYRYVIAFDDNNNIVNEVEQMWDGSEWNNSYRYLYVFDENNNLINESIQSWEENDWENRNLYSYTYDINNNITSGLIQRHNGTNWENDTYYTITYDANQNQLSYTLQEWDNSEWVNVGQYLYTYDGNNNLTSNLYQNWNENAWENVIQYLFTYDASDLLSTELSQYWVEGAWEDYARFSFNYNSMDQLIHQFVETWTGSAWVDVDYYTYTYDANGNETSELREVWNGIEWIHSEESAFEYTDTLLLSEVYKYYNDSGNAVEYGDSAYYYFHQITGTESPADLNNEINVYPNPGKGKVTISSSLPITSMQIFTLQGQIVHGQDGYSGQKTVEADLSLAGKGMYFAKIVCEGNAYSKMIVIQ